jgi:hypothetical protein
VSWTGDLRQTLAPVSAYQPTTWLDPKDSPALGLLMKPPAKPLSFCFVKAKSPLFAGIGYSLAGTRASGAGDCTARTPIVTQPEPHPD